MATTSGTLVNDVKSPYAGPYVHYSCTYTAERADSASANVSVTLNFKAWLNSSASKLGTGIVLYLYARLSGGSWTRVTVKSSSASWSGTTKRDVPAVTLTGHSTGDKINVEFYVVRGDSGGNSGKLGTASSPKKYAAKLPAYGGGTSSPSPSAGDGFVYVKAGGVWKKAVPYVRTGGAWKQATPYCKSNGAWKKGVI